jgi:uncharacterized membrane protein
MHYFRKTGTTLRTYFYRLETYEFFVICAMVVYVFFWSLIDILQQFNFQQYVFDSGIISLTMNSIIHYHYARYIMYMTGFSLLRIIFSPLILIDGITGMLIIQEIFLALPSLIIYKIARKKSINQFTSMIIGISYLLYFPLAGLNYFNFHFQAFFILFFLMGYYQFLNQKYISSTILFFLSGIVRFPYMAFPALLMLMILTETYFNRRKLEKRQMDSLLKFSLASLIIFSSMIIISYFLIFYSPYYIYQNGYFDGYFHLKTGNLLNLLMDNIDDKALLFILIFSPLLLIPLKSIKWMIFTIPFFLIAFFNNYSIYYYPAFFHFQYVAAVAPFVFLGLIDAIRIDALDKNEKDHSLKNAHNYFNRFRKTIRLQKKLIALMASVILFALLFQPYSPINAYSTEPFAMDILHPSLGVYDDYINITNLIPSSNPYVIYQNNLPYVDVHDPSLSCLGAFQSLSGYNSNLSYRLQNLTETENVDYALAYDVNCFNTGNSLDMCQAMNILYSRGNYGIEAFQNGFILLAKDYNKMPVYFTPISLYSNVTAISHTHNESRINFYPEVMIPGLYYLNITFPKGMNYSLVHNINITARSVSVTSKVTHSNVSITNRIYILHLQFKIDSFLGDPLVELSLPNSYYNHTMYVSMTGPVM